MLTTPRADFAPSRSLTRTSSERFHARSAAALAASLALASVLRAQTTYYWDGDGSGSVGGGSSATNWNQSNEHWSTTPGGHTYVAWNNAGNPANYDHAVFQGAAGDITISGDVNVGDLTFDTSGYALSGGTITLGSSSSIATGSGTQTIDSVLAGASGFTKTQNGILILGGANTYSGATTIANGTLRLAANGVMPNASAVSISSGATFDLNGHNDTVGSITGSGAIKLGDGTLITGHDDSSHVFSGVISESGSLVKTGAGTLTLSAANTFSGTTTISEGTLAVSNSLALQNSTVILAGGALSFGVGSPTLGGLSSSVATPGGAGVTLDLSGLATLTVGNNNASTTFSGALKNGTLVKAGTGTLTLDGNADNSYLNLVVSAGTVELGKIGAYDESAVYVIDSIAAGATVRLASVSSAGQISDAGGFAYTHSGGINGLAGTFDLNGHTEHVSKFNGSATGRVTNTGATFGELYVGAADAVSSDLVFAGVIQDGTGTTGLSKLNGTTLTLTGANTYTGGTILYGGVLQIGAGGTTGSLVAAGGINAGATTQVLFNRSNAITYAGVIDGAGSVVQGGTGALTLTGANTFGGGLFVNSGVIAASADAPLGVSWGAVTLGGGTFKVTSSFTLNSSRTLTASGGVLSVDEDATLTFGGVATGGSSLVKSGAGTLTLSGTADNVGLGLTVSGGTTLLAKSSNADVHSVSVVHSVASGTTLRLGGTGGDQIHDAGGIGDLAGTFDLAGHSETIDLFASSSGGLVTNTSATAATLTVGANNATDASLAFAGVIQNGAGLTALAKIGGGALTLSGANTYSGDTTISGGTLKIGAVNASSPNSAVTIADGAVLDLNGFNDTIGSLAGAGVVTNLGGDNSAVTLTVGANNTTPAVFTGDIRDGTGSTALVKVGSGRLTLSGTYSYSGGTLISAGTLQLGNADASGSLAGDIVDNGTLSFDRTDVFTFPNLISGTGAVIQNGSGTLLLTANNTYTGSTTINDGFLVIDADTRLGNGGAVSFDGGVLKLTASFDTARAISLVGNGTLNLVGTGVASTWSGLISGSGSLSKNGSGTLTLTHANTFTGATTINTGTLAIDAENRLGANPPQLSTAQLKLDGGTLLTTANVTINDTHRGVTLATGGGTFKTNPDTTLTIANAIIGGGSLTKTGNGTLSLSGANAYTGGTALNAGTLALGSLNALGFVGDLAFGGGTLQFGPANNTDYSFRIVGSSGAISLDTNGRDVLFATPLGATNTGGLTKSGAGTLTLPVANDYTGTTTLGGGGLRATNPRSLGTGPLLINGGALELAANSGLAVNLATTLAASTTITSDRVAAGAGVTHSLGSLSVGAFTLTTAAGANVTSGTSGLAFGATTLTGAATFSAGVGTRLTLASLTGTNRAATFTGAGDTTITGAVAIGTGLVTKSGPGTLTFAGNSQTGSTSIFGGTLALTGSGSTATGGTINVGGDAITAGTGSFAISNGASATYSQSTLGSISGSSGDASVSGPGASWTSNGLYIGSHGTGSLTIANGASVSTTENIIGWHTNSSGAVFISGAGSALINDMIAVAAYGAGSLSVTGGASVFSNNAFLASGGASSSGSATLSGAGSSWTNSDTLIVGQAGAASLAISGSASLSSSSSLMGTTPGSSAIATVSGLGSVWNSDDDLQIGLQGAGALTLSDRGKITVNHGSGTVTLGANSNGAGILNLGAAANAGAASAGIVNVATITTGDGAGTLQFNTTGTVAAPTYLTHDGTASGTGVATSGALALVHTAGVTVLTGTLDHSGATTVNGGTLRINGALTTSPVTVASGATLGGSGTLGGTLALASGAILAPGNSPGLLTSGDTTFDSGARFEFEINGATGTAGANWDKLAVNGTLTLAPGATIFIDAVSLLGNNSPGVLSGLLPGQTYAWTFASATGGIGGFNTATFAVNTSRFTSIGGSFSVVLGNNAGAGPAASSLDLVFLADALAIPEPASYVAFAGIATLAFATCRRRRAAA